MWMGHLECLVSRYLHIKFSFSLSIDLGLPLNQYSRREKVMVALISDALLGICFLMTCIHLVSAFGSKPQHGIPSRKITKALSSIVKNKFNGDDLISVEEIHDFRRTKIGSKLDGSPTLVLNADYTPLSHVPLSIWNWQDSLRAIFNGKAVVVAEYHDIVIRSVSTSINLPSVIALKTFHKKPNGVPPMTRRYVFIRDGFKCQVTKKYSSF